MAIIVCVQDTNSIDLGQDPDTGMLTAALREHPAGAILSDGSGVYIGLSSTSGLAIASNRLTVDADGDGVGLNATGTSKVNNVTREQWLPFATDDTSVFNAAINRGALVQVGTSLRLTHTIPQSSSTVARYRVTWRGQYSTNYPSLGDPGNVLDAISVILQFSYDFGAWTTADQATIGGIDHTSSYQLDGEISATEGAAASHTLDARLVTFGGTTSATSRQGVLNTSYHRGIIKYW